MQLEIQIALNYVINFLYNKLPRRRVNIFGEELEKALKDKFQGHWYPEKPFKVSSFFFYMLCFIFILEVIGNGLFPCAFTSKVAKPWFLYVHFEFGFCIG